MRSVVGTSRGAPAMIILMIVVSSVLLLGCEENIVPPSDLDMPFSMYGILSPTDSFQTIAVSPIEPLLFDYPDSIDATVTSTNISTGEVVEWRDSIVVGTYGQKDHIFWAQLTPSYGDTYLVESVRSDGASSSARARVPPRISISYNSNTPQYLVVLVKGSDINLLRASVRYTAHGYTIHSATPCIGKAQLFEVSYSVKDARDVDSYSILVNIERDHYRIRDKYNLNWIVGVSKLALTKMHLVLLIGDKDWEFNDTLDDVPINFRSASSNVTNGLGLVSGGYPSELRLYPSRDVLEDTGFSDYLLRPPKTCLDYCACSH